MKIQTNIIRLLAFSLLALTSCSNNSTDKKELSLEVDNSQANKTSSPSNKSTYFKEVTIGNQVWMSENLDVEKFRNGDPIPEAKTDEQWRRAGEVKQPAWCYYDNNPVNGRKYGRLYNWYAVNDPRGLAPAEYHIPNANEWSILENYLGENAGAKLRAMSGWNSNKRYGKNSTNSSGFTGLPGGERNNILKFFDAGNSGYWWSSTEGSDTNALMRYLNYSDNYFNRYFVEKSFGLSIRCIKNK
jgi:uncharacterized protein (TIGR02145 family)